LAAIKEHANLITVRSAREDDLDVIVELLQGVSVYRPCQPVEWFIDDHNHGYVVVDGDKIIGFLSWHLLKKVRGSNVAVIEDVVVDASKRKLGVGKRLIQYALEEIRTYKDVYKIILESSKEGEHLYLGQGFMFSDNKALYMKVNDNEDINHR
jgi:GNAT superfamily N-acetyltransferase